MLEVAVIFEIAGACRRDELGYRRHRYNINCHFDSIQNNEQTFVIKSEVEKGLNLIFITNLGNYIFVLVITEMKMLMLRHLLNFRK